MGVGREALSRSVLRRETVDIPEWGGSVTVREMTAGEQAEILALGSSAVDMSNGEMRDARQSMRTQAMMVVFGWIDDAGANVLGPGDVDELMHQPLHVLQKLAMAVQRLSNGPKA